MPDLNRAHSRSLLLLFCVATLVAAACSSSPTVEASDVVETTEASDSAGTDADAVEESEDADEDEGETEEAAMGEDEAEDSETEPDPGNDADEPEDESPTTTTDSAIGSADLAAALAAGQDIQFSLPFLYLTVDQSCSGCAETVSLYYVPGAVTPSILSLETAFVDGSEVPLTEVDPILQEGDPRLVAELLADADAQGTLDSFSIDPVSGLVTSWVVDGNEITLRCLQVDTRPLELRSEVCRDSLIG